MRRIVMAAPPDCQSVMRLGDPVIISEAFSGNSLNGSWAPYTVSPSTVTVEDALLLNNNGGNWTGAQARSGFIIPMFCGAINISVWWKPNVDRYGSADRPAILLVDPLSTRDTYYGSYNTRLVGIMLAKDGDTNNRTAISVRSTGTSPNRSGIERGAVSVDIDESEWHKLLIRVVPNGQAQAILDDAFYLSALVPASDWLSYGAFMAIVFCNPDYAKTNTERFKDLTVWLG